MTGQVTTETGAQMMDQKKHNPKTRKTGAQFGACRKGLDKTMVLFTLLHL